MSSDAQLEIPDGAPRWSWPLFTDLHLLRVRVGTIEEQGKATNTALTEVKAQLERGPLSAIGPREWVAIILTALSIIGGAFGVTHINTPSLDPEPPAVQAGP